MHSSLILLSIPFLVSSTLAAPNPGKVIARQNNPTFRCYHDADFPSQSSWLSYDALWEANLPLLSKVNSESENKAISTSFMAVAQSAGMDPRVLLAQAMQETGGNLHLPCGDSGLSCGILQVQLPAGEAAKCSGMAKGACESNTITAMVQQGVFGHAGTGSPKAPGIANCLKSQNGKVGEALRCYNTGSVPNAADLSQASPSSTPSYVSSVANRLMGVTVIPDKSVLLSQCGFKDPW